MVLKGDQCLRMREVSQVFHDCVVPGENEITKLGTADSHFCVPAIQSFPALRSIVDSFIGQGSSAAGSSKASMLRAFNGPHLNRLVA